MLSEAAITDDLRCSKHVDIEHFWSNSNENYNKMFPMAAHNLQSDKNSHNLYTVRDLRLMCSELRDVLHANNKSYDVLILLYVITVFTMSVPTTYSGVTSIKDAILKNGSFQLYVKGLAVLFVCAVLLFVFLWLTTCCHGTTEEVQDILTCIQKLLLYPNALGWSTSELKSFSSQLKNNKADFNVSGFFTLNLQFFSASVSVIFTYILVLNQFS
jgi:hypothetical protein